MEAGTCVTDLRKFYALVSHNELKLEAEATGYNMKLVRALRVMYSANRAIQHQGAVSEPFSVGVGIIAGCNNAKAVGKVLLVRL